MGGAALAVAALVALALTGRRPEPGLVPFEAAGVMAAIPVETISAVDVRAHDRHWRFQRSGEGWRQTGSAAPGADATTLVSAALRFLHASAPQQRLPGIEIASPQRAEFGLDPPRYVVSVRAEGPRPFEVAFGAINPQGLAQYVQVATDPDVLLLPRYVGEAWEAAIRGFGPAPRR